MNTNTIILTDICEYEYEYYHNQNKNKTIDLFMDIKAIKACKLMHIWAIIYNLWCLVYKSKKIQYFMIWFNIFLMNTNTNIFGLTKKGQIQIKIYLVWRKKGWIRIWIYSGWQKRANTNTNTNNQTGIREYEYKYKDSSHTALNVMEHKRTKDGNPCV